MAENAKKYTSSSKNIGTSILPRKKLTLVKKLIVKPRRNKSEVGEYEEMPGEDQLIPQGENTQHKVAHKRMEQQKAQIAEVTGILKKNVDLILQRDEKLTDLDDRAEALNDEASEFGKQTGKLKRKYWWKNCKMLSILIGICLFIFIIIIVWALTKEDYEE